MEYKGTIYYDIFKTVRTVDEQITFLNGIDILLKQIYQNLPVTSESIEDLFGEQAGSAIVQRIGAQHIDLANISAVKDFFIGLEEYAKTAEIIRATLSVVPDEGVKEMLGQWMQHTFPSQAVVMELKQDVSIVAGIQIAYKGRYWDFSLEQQVAKVFAEKKDQLFGDKV